MGISVQQAITYAYNAGFRGEQIVVIVSISLCECGSQACGCNYDCCPASQSCGVLQIFQYAHPGTAACAVDPACAYRLGWQISSNGQSFHPWTTYNNGCYLSHTATVRAALAAMPAPIGSGPGPPPPPPPEDVCPPGWTLLGNSCIPPGVFAPPPFSGDGLIALLLVGGGVSAYAYARRRRGESALPARLEFWHHPAAGDRLARRGGFSG